jgi:hypothetical protein
VAETKGKGTRPGYLKVEGLDQLRRDLRRLEDKVSKKELQQTLKADLRDAAQIVADAARQRAPYKTGRLRDTVRPKGALRGSAVLAGGIKGVRYAGPIHWGWPTRPNPAKGWRGGPIKGYRFMYGAAMARYDTVKDRMERTVARIAAEVKGA